MLYQKIFMSKVYILSIKQFPESPFYQLPMAAITNYHKWRLKTRGICYVTILKSKVSITGPKSRCQQGCTTGSFRGKSLPYLIQLPVATTFLGLWSHLSNFSLCCHIAFSSICQIFLCLPLIKRHVIVFKVYQANPG